MKLDEFEDLWMKYITNGRYKRAADPRLVHRAGSSVVSLFEYWNGGEWGYSKWRIHNNRLDFIGGSCCSFELAMTQYMGEVAKTT